MYKDGCCHTSQHVLFSPKIYIYISECMNVIISFSYYALESGQLFKPYTYEIGMTLIICLKVFPQFSLVQSCVLFDIKWLECVYFYCQNILLFCQVIYKVYKSFVIDVSVLVPYCQYCIIQWNVNGKTRICQCIFYCTGCRLNTFLPGDWWSLTKDADVTSTGFLNRNMNCILS